MSHLFHRPPTQEVRVRAQAAATPAGVKLPKVNSRQRFPDGSITIAGLPYFLIPDDDPWRRERWRRLGERPEPDAL